MTPENDKGSVGLDAFLARYSALLDDVNANELLEEQCAQLMVRDKSFAADLQDIRCDPRFDIPATLTTEIDKLPRQALDDAFSKRVEIALAETLLWVAEHPDAKADDVKSHIEVLNQLLDEPSDESDIGRHGFILGQMTRKRRVEFYKAIRALLTRRGLSPLFFEWTKWLVLYRIENKHLRPYRPLWLAFTVVQNANHIEHFHLTTKQKDEIRESVKAQLGVIGRRHFSKGVKKELEALLVRSKNIGVKPKRGIMSNEYEAHDNLSSNDAATLEKRREWRVRKHKERRLKRTTRLTGKKLEK